MFKVFKGSGIESNYSVSANPSFVSNNVWTIYPAKHRTTKKRYSVWQFSKREMETRLQTNGLLNRTNKTLLMEDVCTTIRNYITNLAKFKHPNFLTVIEPVEDHKSRILFVTEYVVNDLETLSKSDLDEIIITKGLLQLALGLKFLHQSVHTVHMNITPSSVFVTENFDWKLSGMQFIELVENSVQEKYIDPLDSRLPSFLGLDFRFSSPNLLVKHNVDYINDLFSIGCLIFYLFNEGEPLIDCSSSSLLEYERAVQKLRRVLDSAKLHSHASFNNIPANYMDIFIKLLTDTQETNKDVLTFKSPLTVDDLLGSKIFNNELIRILNVIDEFPTLGQPEKSEFLYSLTRDISQFPRALLINKFIPLLSDLVTPLLALKTLADHDEKIITLSCENLLILSNQLSQLTFTDKIFPLLSKVLNDKDLTSYELLLLSNLDTIKTKLNANEHDLSSKYTAQFQTLLNKLFEKSLVANNDPNTVQLQEKVLVSLPTFLNFQSYSTISTKMFPAICQLFSSTSSLKIKNLTINAFDVMISKMGEKNLDTYVIVEKLLPLVQNTHASNFKNANLLMNTVQLYETIFKRLHTSPATISVANNKVDVAELIRNTIFFELWKLTVYVTRKSDLDVIFRIVADVETYLKKSIMSQLKEEHAPAPQIRSTPVVQTTTTPAPAPAPVVDDFDDFASFDTFQPAMKPTPAAPLKLEPKKQWTPAAVAPTAQKPATSDPFSLLQPMKATRVSSPQPQNTPSPQPSPQPSTIDWSRTMTPKPKNTSTYNSLI
ncbi:hypothetical protein OGAPHI_003360 [Ogataea philodendri]|uniref:Protein kinase domain-containing protein n=1 Tax=Ogataea philodendri TaxID=1378263 RepID=A0A9P8P8E1_9ASCO|nr:uncharacterized protein OGAPHI_003360 [Ogataea philodendri]KAH3666910.1 hypothetical protein OGAPHI_003360 [Ogataea philodendri]